MRWKSVVAETPGTERKYYCDLDNLSPVAIRVSVQ